MKFFTRSQISEVNEEKVSRAVDINHLLARVRKKKKQQNKINIILFGMFVALILFLGILLALITMTIIYKKRKTFKSS